VRVSTLTLIMTANTHTFVCFHFLEACLLLTRRTGCSMCDWIEVGDACLRENKLASAMSS
jgi:hypothetical protein